MIESWTLVDPGLVAESTGHHYAEAKAIVDELQLIGLRASILSYRDVPAAKFPNCEVLPIFSLYSYEKVGSSAEENVNAHNERFEQELTKLDPARFENSLLLFPTMRERHLRGLLHWLGRFDDNSRPIAVLILAELPVVLDPFIVTAYRQIWAECPQAIKKRIVLYARTPEAVEQFGNILGQRPCLIPSLLGVAARFLNSASPLTESWGDRMIVSFMGNARENKGSAIVPDVVRACRTLDIGFFIQIKPDSAFAEDLSAMKALAHAPNVQIHEGFLDQRDYYGVIKRSIVLLAFYPQAYRGRSSGVYNEAVSLGAPLVVSDGTWMSENVRSEKNGLVFAKYTPEAVAECLAEAQRHLPQLRVNAASYAQKFRAGNGPDRYVDDIMKLARAAAN